MKYAAIFLLTISSTVFAQSVGPQDVEPMLQQMQASGKISAQQAELTRKYMGKMKAKQWADVEKRANDCLARNPALAEKFEEGGVAALSVNDCAASGIDPTVHKVEP
jgi:hypothetical protein